MGERQAATEMADAGLFGDDRDEVGPLVMEDDGEEWFPFTLENLEEMENTGGNAPCLKPMHQVPCVRVSLARSGQSEFQ